MITVLPRVNIVFVRGIHRMDEIDDAIKEATGQKTVNRRRWSMFPVPDENSVSMSIVTGNAFQPPDVDRAEIGYKTKTK